MHQNANESSRRAVDDAPRMAGETHQERPHLRKIFLVEEAEGTRSLRDQRVLLLFLGKGSCNLREQTRPLDRQFSTIFVHVHNDFPCRRLYRPFYRRDRPRDRASFEVLFPFTSDIFPRARARRVSAGSRVFVIDFRAVNKRFIAFAISSRLIPRFSLPFGD